MKNKAKQIFFKKIQKEKIKQFTKNSKFTIKKKKIQNYINILNRHNKKKNLTSSKNEITVTTKHIFDTIIQIPYIKYTKKILDIGSGNGIPGIIYSILKKNNKIIILDKNKKKILFLNNIKLILKIKNLTIIKKKIENYNKKTKFNLITSRFFTKIDDFLNKTKKISKEDTIYLTNKIKLSKNEKIEILKKKIFKKTIKTLGTKIKKKIFLIKK